MILSEILCCYPFFFIKISSKAPEEKCPICKEQFGILQIILGSAFKLSRLCIAPSGSLRIKSHFENYYPIVNDNLVSCSERGVYKEFIFILEQTKNTIHESFEVESDSYYDIKINRAESIN